MDALWSEPIDFFWANVPSFRALVVGGPPALLWSALCLLLAGLLKTRLHWATGYTRKLFHFLVFGSVVVVHGVWGVPGVCLFGAMTTLTLAFALLRGPDHILYEAIAREKDAPRRTHYVVVPYFATLAGGMISNMFFPTAAVFGYLVTGLGDAVAEPVGTRWGRHEYRVPARRGVPAMRSVEGSAAVMLSSGLALLACLTLSPEFPLTGNSVLAIAIIAAVSTVVEALSPHGWDNATLQVIPAWLGTLFF